MFEHLLDEIDASARTVELVAEENEGWTGGGAKAAMDAGAQDLVRLGRGGICELRQRKICLHDVLT
jgi:hypothetical protein